jgi:hypothetical protein
MVLVGVIDKVEPGGVALQHQLLLIPLQEVGKGCSKTHRAEEGATF